MSQMFLNILTNAAEAITEGGEIKIVSSVGLDGVVVEVRDNGGGMSSETLKRIFDPGFTTKGVGVGAGSAIMALFIYSLLPIVGTTHAGLTDAERAAAGIPAGTLRISVGVEDTQILVDDLLQALGH